MASEHVFSLVEALRELKEVVSTLAGAVDALAERVSSRAANDNAFAQPPRRSLPKADWRDAAVPKSPEARAAARNAVAKRFGRGR